MPLTCWGSGRKSDIRKYYKNQHLYKIYYFYYPGKLQILDLSLFFQGNVHEFLNHQDWEERGGFFFFGEKCFSVGKWVLSVVSMNLFSYAVISLTYFTCFNQLLLKFGTLQEVWWIICDFWQCCCRENFSYCVKFCSLILGKFGRRHLPSVLSFYF